MNKSIGLHTMRTKSVDPEMSHVRYWVPQPRHSPEKFVKVQSGSDLQQ
jgi:hypothetical protein